MILKKEVDIFEKPFFRKIKSKPGSSKNMNVDPEHLEDMLIELPETQAKQFDAAIESAFRFGDFDAIYRLVYEEELPVDYQVKLK